MANFLLFQKEPAKQFQIVALARSFLSETGFFDRKREKTEEKKHISHGQFPAVSKGARETVPNSSTRAFFSVCQV